MMRYSSCNNWATRLGLMLLICLWTSMVFAYQQWSDNGGNSPVGRCAECHADFNAGSYISLHDSEPWNEDLMDGHKNMVASDCKACHRTGGNKPVYIGLSDGENGLSATSCLGCHGRDADKAGPARCVTGDPATIDPANCGMGVGLRQQHYNAGELVCLDCHDDALPPGLPESIAMPVSESIEPPNYFTPDTSHPDKPTDPCNADPVPGNENKYGTTGLDNDGDGSRDMGDTDCQTGSDSDGDGVLDATDNCTDDANAGQQDADGDGHGNACDADFDNSCFTNFDDLTIMKAAFFTADPNIDLDSSGFVNFDDLTIMKAKFFSAPGPSACGACPCP